MKSVEQRFWEKVGPHDDPKGCWLWQAAYTDARSHLPYGRFWFDGRMVAAHRFSYELCYGPIPEGMTIDHVKARGCNSTLCVNPTHLETVTLRVNILRGSSFAAIKAKQECCRHGHIFNEENTYVWHGRRYCRVCNRESKHAV